MRDILRRYHSSLPIGLRWIFWISTLVIVLQEVLFFRIPAVFDAAPEIGQIIQKVALSFICSIIIYFITTHLPKLQKRNVTKGLVQNSLFMIQIVVYRLIDTIYVNKGQQAPADKDSIVVADIAPLLDRATLVSPVTYTHDDQVYPDFMALLIEAKSLVHQYYNLLIPFSESIPLRQMEMLIRFINILNMVHDPQALYRQRVLLATNAYANLVIDLRDCIKRNKA